MKVRLPLLLTLLVFGLTVLGLIMVGNASVVDAARDFADKWHYLKAQSVWACVGVVSFFVASRFPLSKLEKLATPLFVANLFLLIAVLIPGIGLKLLGARRWLGIGEFVIQPAEVAKLTVSLYLASLFKKKENLKISSLLLVMGVLGGLLLLEPDLGTALIIFGLTVFTFIGVGGKLTHLLILLPVSILAIFVLILVSPYRLARLQSYLNSSQGTQGPSYHIHQVLLGLGSGGIFGVGLGQSRQKYEFLPEATTDSIFVVICEELGFIGGFFVIIAFLVIGYLGTQIVLTATSPFAANLAMAITSWLVLQAVLNFSSMVALTPLTGIPLPFISYGGSSLLVALCGSGLLVNIARQKS